MIDGAFMRCVFLCLSPAADTGSPRKKAKLSKESSGAVPGGSDPTALPSAHPASECEPLQTVSEGRDVSVLFRVLAYCRGTLAVYHCLY